MQHTCYHLISDNKNQFLNSISEVKLTLNTWKEEGESRIKVFKIMTEELGSDAINLKEEQLAIDDERIQ